MATIDIPSPLSCKFPVVGGFVKTTVTSAVKLVDVSLEIQGDRLVMLIVAILQEVLGGQDKDHNS